jgi:predicted dehydrogenase
MRTRTYCDLAARQPHRYQIIAAAEPIPARLELAKKVSRNPDFRGFANDKELFKVGKIADVCIIGTQDAYHVEPCIEAMELGYDVLLEKPIATDARGVVRLLSVAERLGRKVMVCHVLRYSPFYVKVHDIVASGALGDIVTIDAREGVGAFHQTHSFVRGHWSVAAKSTPMLIAKSCHDTDIISWLVGRPCTRVQSFGRTSHFNAANAPAGAPMRCADGCPVGDTCPYNSYLYTNKHRGWLGMVMDGASTATDDEVLAWLTTSPWGRCVYHCDNDAVDHQVVAMEFQGGITGTFTMTAFDSGRNVTICGTKATLRGGSAVEAQAGHDIIVREHTGNVVSYDVSDEVGGYKGHGGGDPGLVQALDHEMAKPAHEMRSGLFASVESHLIGYAAEESRLTGKTVDLAEFRRSLES